MVFSDTYALEPMVSRFQVFFVCCIGLEGKFHRNRKRFRLKMEPGLFAERAKELGFWCRTFHQSHFTCLLWSICPLVKTGNTVFAQKIRLNFWVHVRQRDDLFSAVLKTDLGDRFLSNL